ncbi:MAG: MFS transporter [Pseudomonadota bacterium]|nr:MFS transporter [Pseudomonadota bacterium]
MNIAVGSMTENVSSSASRPLQAWLVVISAAWFFFYEFMILNIFNAFNVPLMQEFNISATTLGWLSSYYSLANLLFLFPAGMLLDRLSTRRVILCAMSVCVLSTFVFAHAPTILVAAVCRFAMGIGGAFCLLSAVRLASRWFPPKKLAFAVGLIITMGFVGGSIAQNPMTLLTEAIGWRNTLMVIGGMGVLMLGMIFAFVRDYPEGYVRHHKTVTKRLGFRTTVKLVTTNRTNWLAGLYTSLLNLPIFLLGMYGTLYLQQIHHLSRGSASLVTMMLFIGTMIGSPAIGWISDRVGRRRLPMLVFGVLSLATMLLLMYVPGWSLFSLLVLFLALGYFTSAQIITYPLVSESNPHNVTGSATGLASTLIMAGLYAQPFFGWLLERHWDQTIIDGVRVYALSDYNSALSIMPIAFILGLVAAAFVKETYCKAVEDNSTAL